MNGGEGINVSTERKKRVEKLIDAIAYGNFNDELCGRLRYWFFCISEDSIEEEVLAEWAARNIKPDTSKPTEKERSEFHKIVALLELDNSQYPAKTRKCTFVPVRRFMLMTAAALIPVLITGGVFFLLNNRANDGTTIEKFTLYANHESGHETFVLPDGSTVTLSNGSTLEHTGDFHSARNVSLDGRAFFDVVHSHAPFSVTHEGFSATVLGTEFNVTAYNNVDKVEVVLVSGRLKINIKDRSVDLIPGDRLVFDKKTSDVLSHSQAEPGVMMRVTGGDLTIRNASAMEAISITADYFDKELVVKETIGTDDLFNIMLPHDISLDAAVMSLSKLSAHTQFSIKGDTIYVSRK